MTWHIATMDRGVFATLETKADAVRFVRNQIVGRFRSVRKIDTMLWCYQAEPTSFYLGTKCAMREHGFFEGERS